MKKSILTAIGLAMALFLYGYVMTELGHDDDNEEQEHESEHSVDNPAQ